MFVEIATQPDAEIIAFCSYAQMLASTGRGEEARVQLEKVEQLVKPYADNKIADQLGWTKLVNETREAVEKAQVSQPPSGDYGNEITKNTADA